MNANQLLQTKTIEEMTIPELGIVMRRAKDAFFENSINSKMAAIDMRKRAMGEWALNIFKDKKNDFILRGKVKNKYREHINYFLKFKVLPELPESEKKVTDLIRIIDIELFIRKISSYLDIDKNVD